MKLDQEDVRYMIGTSLALITATIAVYLWFLDQFSMQRVFGALLGSELVAFAMIVYVYSKSLSEVNKKWLLTGCVAVALFLFIGLMVASQ